MECFHVRGRIYVEMNQGSFGLCTPLQDVFRTFDFYEEHDEEWFVRFYDRSPGSQE